MCAVYEKYAEYFITESSNRVCGGRHGGSVHLESAGSGDGTGGGYGAVGICACCGRLLAWNPVPAGSGQDNPASASGQQ